MDYKDYVYPAYAGVILDAKLSVSSTFRLSRIRGGDPGYVEIPESHPVFIPHTRG